MTRALLKRIDVPKVQAMKALLVPMVACSLLAGCTAPRPGPAGAVPQAEAGWRQVATETDRGRIREWRTAWLRALEAARAAGHGPAIEAEGPLLKPDAAVAAVTPPAGDYRCRVTKLGAKQEGLLDYVAYPAFRCRIGPGGETREFSKLTGSQRPVGRLFPDSDRRMVFLGTLQLGDEQGVLRYGHDEDRALAGVLERIGERRWRLVFPYPHFESLVDVIELIPEE